MTPEQFEQAKIEFAEKWGYQQRESKRADAGPTWATYHGNELLSDLNSLLEQHKEVMMEFTEWTSKKAIDGLAYVKENKTWGVCELGNFIEFTTAELFNYWLKNVKK